MERKRIPLSDEEQEKRRPLPVGVLLSGDSAPLPLKEKAVKIKVRRTPLTGS